MRVWLVDEKQGGESRSLEALLRQLEEDPGRQVQILGASPFQADFPAAMRRLVPDLLDLIVINERAWPAEASVQAVLELGVGVVVVTTAERVERFRRLADTYPIWFVHASIGAEELWLALLGAFAGQRRLASWRNQVDCLQQRLNDRIVIERAKGILIQRLGLTEEDAYRRLRVLARRQQRPIREIAQSLLDMHALLLPETNGSGLCRDEEQLPELDIPLSLAAAAQGERARPPCGPADRSSRVAGGD